MSETLDYAEAASAQEDYEPGHVESYQEKPVEQSYQQQSTQEAFERDQQETVRGAVYEASTDAPTQQSLLGKLGLDWVTTESFLTWNCLTISLTAILVLILVYVLYKFVGPKSRRARSKEAKKKFKLQQNDSSEGKKKI